MSCRWRGWVSLNFLQLEPTRLPNETVHLQKEKWWHLHHKSKTLGGASVGRSCHCCHWKPSWCECPILQEAVRKFAAAPGAAPIAGRFSPGPSLTRSGSLPGATISGGYSCSQRPLTFTCPPLLCVTQTLQRGEESGRCHPMQQEGWLGGSDVVDTHLGKFCACTAPSPVNADGRSWLISTSTETLKRLKKKSGQQLRRLWPRRNFAVTRPIRLLSSLLLDLRRQTGLQACRCRRCLFGSSLLPPGVLSLPLKTAVPLPLLSPWRWGSDHWGVLSCSSTS